MKPLVFTSCFFLIGCSQRNRVPSSLAEETIPVFENEHVVMVVDSGFDPNFEVYKSKVIGRFTLTCALTGTEDHMAVMKELQEQIAKNSSEPLIFGQKCYLSKEIAELDSQHLNPDYAHLREEWNRHIEDNKLMPQELFSLYSKLKGKLEGYHGTMVTSLIAYKNPKVRFVLVDFRNLIKITHGYCPDIKANYKEGLSFLRDPSRRNILEEKAVLSEWQILDELARKYHVSMVNKSYGTTRAYFNKVYLTCDEETRNLVNEYYYERSEISEKIARRMNIFYEQEPFLTLQSAGNESLEINSKKDFFECTHTPKHIVIGSYASPKDRSYFSNYGECVDFYSPGSHIVSSIPSRFLVVINGTSFAAPLTVRYISMEFHPREDPLHIRSELEKRLDAQHFLVFDKQSEYAEYKGPHMFFLREEAFDPTMEEAQ